MDKDKTIRRSQAGEVRQTKQRIESYNRSVGKPCVSEFDSFEDYFDALCKWQCVKKPMGV